MSTTVRSDTPISAGLFQLGRSTPTIDIARDLLADPAVRSLTVDQRSGRAVLRFRDRQDQLSTLASLAARHGHDSNRLAATTIARLPADRIEAWPDSSADRINYLRAPDQARGWRRAMHLSLAAVWFALAVLGAILPGLPCTCFLLLCSYSLCRSSVRLHRKLLDSAWFGPTLRHWRVHRGVRPGVKPKALSMLVLMVGASLALAPLPAFAWWAVATAGAIGAACILRLRVIAC